MRGLRRDSIHADATFGDQCLKARAAKIGGVGGEKAVEARACIFVFDGEGEEIGWSLRHG